MDQTVQAAFLSLAGFWTVFKTIMEAAAAVNKLRESIISGAVDKEKISMEHRRGMYTDWRLSMIFVVATSFIFGLSIFWVAYKVHEASGSIADAALPLSASGLVAVLGGISFIWCGISDNQVICAALSKADAEGDALVVPAEPQAA
jgi:hypothetical protein